MCDPSGAEAIDLWAWHSATRLENKKKKKVIETLLKWGNRREKNASPEQQLPSSPLGKSGAVAFATRRGRHTKDLKKLTEQETFGAVTEAAKGQSEERMGVCFKPIKMLLFFNPTNGIRAHEIPGFFQCLDTGSSVSATWPDYQRQLRRKQGPCQLSGSFSCRPASLRPLTASVGTCPRLSNISTLTHTHTHSLSCSLSLSLSLSRISLHTHSHTLKGVEEECLICSFHAGVGATFESRF